MCFLGEIVLNFPLALLVKLNDHKLKITKIEMNSASRVWQGTQVISEVMYIIKQKQRISLA